MLYQRTVAGMALLALVAGLSCHGRAQPGGPQRPPSAAPMVLPPPALKGTLYLEEAIAKRRTVRDFADTTLTWAEIGQLVWSAQGVTDPGGRFRAAPSAGALYPLELYVVTPQGLWRYVPQGHELARVADGDLRPSIQAAALNQVSVGKAPLTLVFAGVYERTAAKYGERAERYVLLEAGHAAQNVLLQACAMGLGAVPIGAFDDGRLRAALSLPANERPLYIVSIGHPR